MWGSLHYSIYGQIKENLHGLILRSVKYVHFVLFCDLGKPVQQKSSLSITHNQNNILFISGVGVADKNVSSESFLHIYKNK